jgi:hypothetical protein
MVSRVPINALLKTITATLAVATTAVSAFADASGPPLTLDKGLSPEYRPAARTDGRGGPIGRMQAVIASAVNADSKWKDF